jgi:hypothetical protein
MKGIRLFIIAFWKNAVLQLGDSRIQLILQSYNPTILHAQIMAKNTQQHKIMAKNTHTYKVHAWIDN